MRQVDLRSDTVTHPTPEMRQAIFDAELGDDVYGEDPSVNKLEAMAAERLGKEAAVLVASGTMGNLVAVLAHAGRGDEIVLGDQAHIFRSEAGGVSALGGIAFQTLPTDQRGMLDPDDVAKAIKPSNVHFTHTALVALENTHNASGGSVLSPEDIKLIADVAHAADVPVHVDGARVFNAAVALEAPVSELAKDVDSITFCLSKGLACPVGSIICGTEEYIAQARKWRKMVGGSMRQAGIIAAAGIVALDTMVERLADDHANAQKLANGLNQIDGISIQPERLHTNLVFFEIDHPDRAGLARKLNERGILGGGAQKRWRYVTHYGITEDDIDYTLDVFESTYKETKV